MEKMLAYSAYDDDRPPPPEEVAPGRIARSVLIPANTLSAGNYEVRFDLGIHNKAAHRGRRGHAEFLRRERRRTGAQVSHLAHARPLAPRLGVGRSSA